MALPRGAKMSNDDSSKRLVHNQREQQRARRINDQLETLKSLLESHGRMFPGKVDKLSILLGATRHISMLYNELKSGLKPDAFAAVQARIRKDDPTGDKERDTQPQYSQPRPSPVAQAKKASGSAARRTSRGGGRSGGSDSGDDDDFDENGDGSYDGGRSGSAERRSFHGDDNDTAASAAEERAPSTPLGGSGSRVSSRKRSRAQAESTNAMSSHASLPRPMFHAAASSEDDDAHLGQLPVLYFAHLFDNTELAQCITSQHGQVMAANRQFTALHPAASSDDAFPFAEVSERSALAAKVSQLFLFSTGTEPRSTMVSVNCATSAGTTFQPLVLTVVQGSSRFPPLLHVTVLPTTSQQQPVPALTQPAMLKLEPQRMGMGPGMPSVMSVSPEMGHLHAQVNGGYPAPHSVGAPSPHLDDLAWHGGHAHGSHAPAVPSSVLSPHEQLTSSAWLQQQQQMMQTPGSLGSTSATSGHPGGSDGQAASGGGGSGSAATDGGGGGGLSSRIGSSTDLLFFHM